MGKQFRRGLSAVLAAALLITSCPINVFAEEGTLTLVKQETEATSNASDNSSKVEASDTQSGETINSSESADEKSDSGISNEYASKSPINSEDELNQKTHIENESINDVSLASNSDATYKKDSDENEEDGLNVASPSNANYFERTSVEIDGIKVKVTAEEGVFPKDAKLSVKKVLSSNIHKKDIEAAVDNAKLLEDDIIEEEPETFTFDIKIVDKEGKELQPKDGAEVNVSFERVDDKKSLLDAKVYHLEKTDEKKIEELEKLVNEATEAEDVDDFDYSLLDGEVIDNVSDVHQKVKNKIAEVIKNKELEDSKKLEDLVIKETDFEAVELETEVKEETSLVETTTDGFSYYVVEFYYGNYEYVLDGDKEVTLSEILEALGLSEEIDETTITKVEVSNNKLFVPVHKAVDALDVTSGYTWYVKALKAFSTEEKMTITADGKDYEIKVTDSVKYKVTFDKKGGTGGTDYVLAEYSGTSFLPLNNIIPPTKTGYNFVGYFNADDDDLQYYDNEGTATSTWKVEADGTLYAKWTRKQYVITLDNQGATTPGSKTTTATYGYDMESITIPKKFGHIFNGYFTGVDGAGTKYYDSVGNSSNKWEETSVTTLYASWSEKLSTPIVLDSDDATTQGDTKVNAYYGEDMPTITVPTKKGCIFGGYWSEKGGKGTQYYSAEGTSVHVCDFFSITTLYAKWTKKQTAVCFDNQGGAGKVVLVTATYGEDMPTLESDALPTRDGYLFDGYYSDSDCKGTRYYNSLGTSANKWDIESVTATLYAGWKKTYEVILDGNGATTAGTSKVVCTFNSPMPKIDSLPTRTGYTFDGYYLNKDGSGTKYYNSDGTSAHYFDKTENITIYAKWKEYANYLTFTAQEANSTVKFTPASGTIEYSTDNGDTWADASGVTVTLSKVGDKVCYKGNNVRTNWDHYFKMTGKIAASGSVTSLIDGKGVNPQVVLGSECFMDLFYNCSSLTTAPELIATTLSSGCYCNMFSSCTGLTSAPELPATTVASGCYWGMFSGCKNITKAPTSLPATTLYDSCYEFMFEGCSSLKTAPTLPATTLAYNCYSGMFNYCTSLESAPELPATTLAESCYNSMFSSCKNLSSAPALPATTLADDCYRNMFYGCKSLKTAPALPATTLAEDCYDYMFTDCTGLKMAPALPATTLAKGCYSYMFNNCTSLTEAPALEATTLAESCYDGMFFKCTSLTTAPELLATELPESCYKQMFYGCSSLKINEVGGINVFACPSSIGWESVDGMFSSTGGAFTGTPNEGKTYYLSTSEVTCIVTLDNQGADTPGSTSCEVKYTYAMPEIITPTKTGFGFGGYYEGTNGSGKQYYDANGSSKNNWDKTENATLYAYWVSTDNYLTFTAIDGSATVKLSPASGTAYFSIDNGKTWLSANDVTVNLSKDSKVMYKGIGVTTDSSNHFTMTGKISASGSVTSLTDNIGCYSDVKLSSDCYSYMFSGCTSLTTAPTLPATELDYSCYKGMFMGCTSLTTAPALPATNLGGACYEYMFSGCSSLTTAPALPATTLDWECYYSMFSGCTSLTTAPSLPATTLEYWCYEYMFAGCTNLKTAPALPAKSVGEDCYYYMFAGCTSLEEAPALPATSLDYYCYGYMFKDCTSLKVAPELPATNLVSGCYYYMFAGCTSLTTAPELPATELDYSCYANMFNGCTSLKVSDKGGTVIFTCPSPLPDGAVTDMFASTGGSFTGTPIAGNTYYIAEDFITFSSDAAFSLITAKNWDGTLFYSTDKSTWNTWDGSSITAGQNGTDFYLYLKGDENNTKITGYSQFYSYSWMFTPTKGHKIACKGNIETLRGATDEGPSTTEMSSYCYSGMFYNCPSLTVAPDLPATKMSNGCYKYMFYKCTSLTVAPELPATDLDAGCYYSMFDGCTSLTTAPELPATQLAEDCYRCMFSNCTNLLAPPQLIATQMAKSCYQSMFNGCSTLYINETEGTEFFTCLDESVATDMFTNTSGSFVGTPKNGQKYYYSKTYAVILDNQDPTIFGTTLVNVAYNSAMPSIYIPIKTGYSFAGYWTEREGKGDLYYDSTGTSVRLWDKKDDATLYAYWVVETTKPNLLTFTAEEDNSTVILSVYEGTAYYTVDDGKSWSLADNVMITLKNVGDKVSYRGYGVTTNTSKRFKMTGKIAASGSVMSLTDGYGTNPKLPLTANCYNSMFYGCTSLTTAPELPATELANYCYRQMFFRCMNLTKAPKLPATKLRRACYYHMFEYCSSLTETPELPATVLPNSCYNGMFLDCKGLTKILELPATELESECYLSMFQGCTNLIIVPEQLPATMLANNCYEKMFSGCTSLTKAPELPAKETFSRCYFEMFKGCTSLTTTPELPATLITQYCYENMFYDCDSLTKTPKLPASKLAEGCYKYMFYDCDSLSTVNDLLATELAYSCCCKMFYHCDSLTTAPALPATVLATCCYEDMFFRCSNLTKAPELPAKELSSYCYSGMFSECKSLTKAPELPAKILSRGCYNSMFAVCTSLSTAPELPATVLASSCYENMFLGCTSLTSAPELLATDLTYFCYKNMFSRCSGLTTAPELPANVLNEQCYYGMFAGCSNLTTAPELPVSKLDDYCCYEMFSGCKSLKITTKEGGTRIFTCPNSIPNRAITDMFANTGGDNVGTPKAGVSYYLVGSPECSVEISGETKVTGDLKDILKRTDIDGKTICILRTINHPSLDYSISEGVTVDLAGNTLTAKSISVNGTLADSCNGKGGVRTITAIKNASRNEYIPLYDGSISTSTVYGYRLFKYAYSMEYSDPKGEKIIKKEGKPRDYLKFQYRMKLFNSDGATENPDGYRLLANKDQSNQSIENGESGKLKLSVFFELPNSKDKSKAQRSPYLYNFVSDYTRQYGASKVNAAGNVVDKVFYINLLKYANYKGRIIKTYSSWTVEGGWTSRVNTETKYYKVDDNLNIVETDEKEYEAQYIINSLE